MEITGLLIGFVAGGIIAWIMATLLVRSKTVSKQELEALFAYRPHCSAGETEVHAGR